MRFMVVVPRRGLGIGLSSFSEIDTHPQAFPEDSGSSAMYVHVTRDQTGVAGDVNNRAVFPLAQGSSSPGSSPNGRAAGCAQLLSNSTWLPLSEASWKACIRSRT